MGLLKFTPKSWKHFVEVKSNFSIEKQNKIHMTEMLQELLDTGKLSIGAVPNFNEWGEFDSQSDFKNSNLNR